MGQTTTLTLEPRQEQTVMEITAAEIGEEQNVVHLEANMGAYGKVYATIIFKFNADRSAAHTLRKAGDLLMRTPC